MHARARARRQAAGARSVSCCGTISVRRAFEIGQAARHRLIQHSLARGAHILCAQGMQPVQPPCCNPYSPMVQLCNSHARTRARAYTRTRVDMHVLAHTRHGTAQMMAITPKDLPDEKLRNLFFLLDKNGSNTIDMNELRAFLQARTHTCTHSGTHGRTPARTQAYMHARTHVCMHARTHACMPARPHACVRCPTPIRARTQHAHTHACLARHQPHSTAQTHVNTHTHANTRVGSHSTRRSARCTKRHGGADQ